MFFTPLSLRRGADCRLRAFASDLQLSRALQGTDSLEFLPVVAKAAIIDSGREESMALEQSQSSHRPEFKM